jgi:hypothetical protein
MSYFKLSTGENVQSTGEFELSGGDIQPIPKGTVVKVIAEQVKWDSYGDKPEYISVTWVVQAPAEYKNRKIFQKILVDDADPAKSDKAIRMLGAILHNAGSNFEALGEGKPSSDKLNSIITFKPMFLKLEVWKIEKDEFGNPLAADQIKQGNWVQAVSNNAPQQTAATTQRPVQNLDDDSLPF